MTSMKLSRTAASLLLLSLLAACGPGQEGETPTPKVAPTVAANTPLKDATGVAINANISITFSEAMARESLTATSFIISSGTPATQVPGTVVYSDNQASFWPSSHLAKDTLFTVRLTTGAKSLAGTPLAAEHSWQFTTGADKQLGLPVNLGTAGDFVLLAKSGISTVPTSAVTGDMGVSPAAASYITGFSLTADATNAFSTSPQVTGKIFAADYASPSPANLTTAVSDMELAFTDSAGRAPDVTELGAGDIGGMTLAPGVYKWGTGLLIPTDVTLDGSSTGVWIFQIAQDLTVASAAKVLLTGGALPKNVFWQVSGKAELGTTSHFEGTILGQTSVTLRTGTTLNGRILGQTAIDIDGSTIVAPAR